MGNPKIEHAIAVLANCNPYLPAADHEALREGLQAGGECYARLARAEGTGRGVYDVLKDHLPLQALKDGSNIVWACGKLAERINEIQDAWLHAEEELFNVRGRASEAERRAEELREQFEEALLAMQERNDVHLEVAAASKPVTSVHLSTSGTAHATMAPQSTPTVFPACYACGLPVEVAGEARAYIAGRVEHNVGPAPYPVMARAAGPNLLHASWAAVPNASYYLVSLEGPSDDRETRHAPGTSATFDVHQPGTYRVRVQPVVKQGDRLELLGGVLSNSVNMSILTPTVTAGPTHRDPAVATPAPAPQTPDPGAVFLADVAAELTRACAKHGPMHSLHEAWSVILEELDEVEEAGADPLAAILLRARLERLWRAVKRQGATRDPAAVRKELVQLAAMAARAVVDLEGKDYRV